MLKDYRIKYVSSDGTELNLSGGGIDAHGNAMPSWEYEAVTLNDRIVGLTRKLPEVEVGLIVVADTDEQGIKAKNALYEVPAADRARMTPGRLYLNDWYLTGFVKSVSIDNFWQTRKAAQYVLTFVATDPLWTRETVRSFVPSVSSGGLDFAYDFAYDFATAATADNVTNDDYSPSYIRLTVQGAVDNPTVTIGGNEYRVDVSVLDGERLEVDGLRKTIELVRADGTRKNVFDKRYGAQVVGSGSYIFEKLAPGVSAVTFANGMTFSVTVIEQRAEPRWA